MYKYIVLLFAALCLMTGCNGGDSSSSSSSNSSEAATTISGTATSVGGSVAMFYQPSLIKQTLDALIPSAYADLSGLEAIQSATVQLIEVDEDANQIGDALDTATTTETGEYTLSLPSSYTVGANLMLRITGSDGNTTLRALVVETQVDINPVSEFIIEQLEASSTDFTSLSTDTVLSIKGKIDDYDLVATGATDLDDALELLEDQLGNLVEDTVLAEESEAGDASSMNGNFAEISMDFSLEDWGATCGSGIGQNWGVLTGDSSGSVTITMLQYEENWMGLGLLDDGSVNYDVDTSIDEDDSTTDVNLTTDNLLCVESEYESSVEDDDADYVWRIAPYVSNIQFDTDTQVGFSISKEAQVLYYSEDQSYSIDTDEAIGNAVHLNLSVTAQMPESLADSDLAGSFGVVTIQTRLRTDGKISLYGKTGNLDFDELTMTPTHSKKLSRSADGSVEVEDLIDEGDEEASSFTLSTDTSTVDDKDYPTFTLTYTDSSTITGWINKDLNFLALNKVKSVDEDNSAPGYMKQRVTYGVKLPESLPSLAGKEYRIVLFKQTLGETTAVENDYTNIDSTFTMGSDETSGTVEVNGATVSMASLVYGNADAQVETESFEASETATVSLETNGAAVIKIPDGDNTIKLKGFFNETGSLGIFSVNYREADDDDGHVTGIGFAALIQLP